MPYIIDNVANAEVQFLQKIFIPYLNKYMHVSMTMCTEK